MFEYSFNQAGIQIPKKYSNIIMKDFSAVILALYKSSNSCEHKTSMFVVK